MDKKNEFDEEEMTVELELEDGSVVTCAVVTIQIGRASCRERV